MESRAVRVSGTILLALFVAAAGLPFAAMVSVSLQGMNQIYSPSLSLIPSPVRFENYAAALTGGNWLRYLLNSLLVAGLSTAVSLFVNAMTGYAFARIRFRFRNPLFILVLTGMMIPPQVTLVPLFVLMKNFPLCGGNDWLGRGGTGLVDTYAGLILPYAAGSFGVFLCRQFYLTFPGELDEAARIDGCSRFRAFVRIYLPLSRPALGALAALKFIGAWNEYTWPLVMTNTGADRVTTVQLALTRFQNEGEIFWNQLMAATLVSLTVVLAVFFALQKQFVAGMLAGGVKE